jgi:hypothetical protein
MRYDGHLLPLYKPGNAEDEQVHRMLLARIELTYNRWTTGDPDILAGTDRIRGVS